MTKKKVWNKDIALEYIARNVMVNDNGCHVWQGPKTPQGYGQTGSKGLYRTFGIKGIHRLVVHLVQGFQFTSRSQQVMHSCHNRACCNPEHLSVGTAKENMNEIATMRRLSEAMLKRAGTDRPPMGVETARLVKLLLAEGLRTCVIAKALDLHWKTVYSVKSGKTWRHVEV